MFESVVSKFTNIVRNFVRTIGATLDRSPWFVPVAFLALLFIA